MTPTERARRAYYEIEAFGWRIIHAGPGPVPDDGWPIDIIAKAISDALVFQYGLQYERGEALDALKALMYHLDHGDGHGMAKTEDHARSVIARYSTD